MIYQSIIRPSASLLILIALFFGLGFSAELIAQDDASVYIKITKVKKLDSDLMDVHRDLSKPFIQERIRQGNQLMQVMFKVRYPVSDDAEYDYVMLDLYDDFGDLNLGEKKLADMAYKVFPNANIPVMMDRWDAAARHAGSDVFIVRDAAFPGPGGGNDREPLFVQVNHMKVAAANRSEYLRMESEVFKPVHQARAQSGKMHDWTLAERVMPHGSDWDNNFLTIDVFSAWTEIARDYQKELASVHADKDVEALSQKMSALRELLRTETWELVSIIDKPRQEVSFTVVKEGEGDLPMKGHEVAYKGKWTNAAGEVTFSSDELGYTFYSTIGSSPYDIYFDKALLQTRKEGILDIVMPGLDGLGSAGSFQIELLSFGKPKPDGSKLLKDQIKKKGLKGGKALYEKLQVSNPEGFVFREGAMNSLGYELMADGNIEAALYIFNLNQKNYPKSWNACDSLGDAYHLAGNHFMAKDCYENALKINPDFEASRDKLSKL